MNFLQAITQRKAAGDGPPGLTPKSLADLYFFEAPEGTPVPYIVLSNPSGSVSDDSQTRVTDEVWQVSAHAKSAADAVALRDGFTDWAEVTNGWATVAPEFVDALTPNAPRLMRNPSGTYHAMIDMTIRFDRDRPR